MKTAECTIVLCSWTGCDLMMHPKEALIDGKKFYCYDHIDQATEQRIAESVIDRLLGVELSPCCGEQVDDHGRCKSCQEVVR